MHAVVIFLIEMFLVFHHTLLMVWSQRKSVFVLLHEDTGSKQPRNSLWSLSGRSFSCRCNTHTEIVFLPSLSGRIKHHSIERKSSHKVLSMERLKPIGSTILPKNYLIQAGCTIVNVCGLHHGVVIEQRYDGNNVQTGRIIILSTENFLQII